MSTVPRQRARSSRRRSPARVLAGAAAGCIVLAGLGIGGPAVWARAVATSRLASEADAPQVPVGIVFGAEVQPDGEPSAFLRARLEVAQRLYAAGRIKVILVSGDNSSVHYDEPDAMRRWLVNHGVPEHKVVADYAGFDSYATCVRAKRIFGVDRAILVSQRYHLFRAVALCRSVGIDAWGVGDTSVKAAFPGIWAHGEHREVVANVKMVTDLVSRRQPVLGPHETGVEDALRES